MTITIEHLPLGDLIPYIGNARKHNDQNVSAIASSIAEYGFNDPIAINERDNVVIEGHGRLLAAKKLRLETVPVIKLGHLSEAQIKGYTLIHNRLAEKSEWDNDILANELEKLNEMDFNIDLTGFDSDYFEKDLDQPSFGAGNENDQGKLDSIKILECPKCGGHFESKQAKIVD